MSINYREFIKSQSDVEIVSASELGLDAESSKLVAVEAIFEPNRIHAGQVNVWLFFGKSSKPAKVYRYKNRDAALESARARVAQRVKIAADKVKYRAIRAAKAVELAKQYQVGDVLCASWGYEQTNIDFYQVVGRVGKKTLELREIRANAEYHNSMQGRKTPRVDDFCGEVFRARINDYGSVNICAVCTASLHEKDANGEYRPIDFSSYA